MISFTDSGSVLGAMEIRPGGMVSRIADGETGVSYHVYAPEDHGKEDLSPLLIVFSPGGDGKGIAGKIRETANEKGWIVVGCDNLRNGMKDHELELKMEDEVLDDILANVPHDGKRRYLGGFSGGAMRAYGLSVRRKDEVAGILAYGGWLGGPSYQGEAYPPGLSIAMVNGIDDQGASGWMPIDTRTLRKRGSTVKHFAFEGGHSVAPEEVTAQALSWFDSQRLQGGVDADLLPLDLLVVADDAERREDFVGFLKKHFRDVSAATSDQLTMAKANQADVLVLDSTVRTLPERYTKAMVMIGSSAAMTGERYGSKIDWLCQCLDNEAYLVDTQHAIFKEPIEVKPTLEKKRCPHTGLVIEAWKVEETQKTPGLVASRAHFENAEDSEIISGGVNMKGVRGVPLVREAHRLLWGFIAPPREMTEEGRSVFVNAIVWIHNYDGEQQTSFKGIHERETVQSVLKSPYVDRENLIRWFPKALLEKLNYDKEKLLSHFKGRMDYVHVPTGGGQLTIDLDAERFGTPNHAPGSVTKWIELLGGEEKKTAQALLYRYTGKKIRRQKHWAEWWEANRDHLVFSDSDGYRFVPEAGSEPPTAEIEDGGLTDISPILFDTKLGKVPHIIAGVSYQYPGKKVILEIRARVKEGWHFYSATGDNGTNLPTEIKVKLPQGMSFDGGWQYPEADEGKLNDNAIFRRTVLVGKEPVDAAEISGTIKFQACKETRCLMPQNFSFSLPLRIVERH
ncbi:protein-disulfide reductase DsbD domain-containing protein [Luteolibacter algae]|uniref:Protein-disulfide reductase DsbD domain-containing protein n=1 Tax=Luteolibacter algae TaxID=454151 RepID=A0ABW5D9K6_9BACT